LQDYIDKGIAANQKMIENAGNEIKKKSYTDIIDVCYEALEEKYRKLAEIAKTKDDPMAYIARKYGDPSCSWYAADLSKEERNIAWKYERRMLTEGKLMGFSPGDSLFRGMEFNACDMQVDGYIYDRQIVNAQIGNIMKENGIEWNSDNGCTFSVDPYSYYITVSGTDDVIKLQMEQALNKGENGKNLYRHILNCSIQDGANSTQYSKEGCNKYQAYEYVKQYTGYSLNELEERDGNYYTDDGQNVLDLLKQGLDKANDSVPQFRQDIIDWISEMTHEVASKGWKNTKDMVLEIRYSSKGLSDMHQDINFECGGEWVQKWKEGKEILMLKNY
jgi:hypothetical protein